MTPGHFLQHHHQDKLYKYKNQQLVHSALLLRSHLVPTLYWRFFDALKPRLFSDTNSERARRVLNDKNDLGRSVASGLQSSPRPLSCWEFSGDQGEILEETFTDNVQTNICGKFVFSHAREVQKNVWTWVNVWEQLVTFGNIYTFSTVWQNFYMWTVGY